MKIAHIINSLNIGGAEKLIVDIVPLFQKKSLEVDVITLDAEETAFTKEMQKSSNGKLVQLSTGSVYNPALIFKMIPYLRRYDIVHIHLFPSLYWVVIAKWLSFSKTKLVYTEHSTYNRRMNNSLFRSIDKLIYKSIYKIVTISEYVDVRIKSHLELPLNHFSLINNGVDIDSFKNALPYEKEDFFNDTDIIIIQVSSFNDAKDQPTLIKSLTLLPEKVKLLLVGDGHLIEENKKLARTLDLNNRIIFLGNRIDIDRLLHTADIVVLSSHYEGLSLSSIEGMSVGKPFIASDVPGLREIVKGHGIIFKKGDHIELADKIIELIENPEYGKYIAQKCYEKAKNYDINKMVNSYIKLYKEVHRNI